MRPRTAITLVFFVNGALFASWASRIPALSDRTGATTGVLGLALLAPAIGAVIAMPLVGRLLPGRSSRAFCRVAIAGLTAAILLPALARSVPALAGALLVVGATNATLDLVMNAQGVSVERHLGRPILSSMHAAFSFGGFAGAGLGALAAALRVAPLPHFALAALLFGIPGLIATRSLLVEDEDADAHAATLAWKRVPGRLALLGVIGCVCLVAEGGASDWSAKLVRDDLAGTAALGALAYAVFSVAMGSGRLIADRLWARWGAVGLLRRCGALAAVSSLGYIGFLAGPPLIGGVAQLTSLRLACGLLARAGLLVMLLASSAAPPRPRAAARAQASLTT